MLLLGDHPARFFMIAKTKLPTMTKETRPVSFPEPFK
jgi:hypothetical protein